MKIKKFGSDPFNWDVGTCSDDGFYLPGIMTFANAVQVWSLAQEDDTTITDAAKVFNVEPQFIREAVEHHPYLFVGPGDVIQHDGE